MFFVYIWVSICCLCVVDFRFRHFPFFVLACSLVFLLLHCSGYVLYAGMSVVSLNTCVCVFSCMCVSVVYITMYALNRIWEKYSLLLCLFVLVSSSLLSLLLFAVVSVCRHLNSVMAIFQNTSSNALDVCSFRSELSVSCVFFSVIATNILSLSLSTLSLCCLVTTLKGDTYFD